MSLNVANRVIVTLLAAAAAAAAVGAAMALFGLWFPDPAVFGNALATAVGDLADLSGTQAMLVAVVLIGLFLASAFVVGLELRPARTRPYLISSTEMGDVVVERNTVVEFVEHVGRGVSGVQAITARVSLEETGALVIRCAITVGTSSVLADLAANVRDAITDKVEGQLGLAVERIDSRMKMTTRRTRRPSVK